MMPFFFSKLKQFFLWFKQKAPQYNLVFENVGTGLLGMWVSDANSSESRKRHHASRSHTAKRSERPSQVGLILTHFYELFTGLRQNQGQN